MELTNHPSVIRLIQNLMSKIPIKESGTYDRADPTHFENGWVQITPNLKLVIKDCTWAVDISIKYESKYLFKGDRILFGVQYTHFGYGKYEVKFKKPTQSSLILKYLWKLNKRLPDLPIYDDECDEYYDLCPSA